jgi:hypothetical protein
MRRIVLTLLIALGASSCAARRPYLSAPDAKENVSGGISGASLDLTAKGCRLSLAIKGGGVGEVAVPRVWCDDAKRAMTVLAAVPASPPAPTPAPAASGAAAEKGK